MSDSAKRALRTFGQAFLGAVITSGVLSATSESGVVDWSALKKVAIAAVFAGIIALVTWSQNALEEGGIIKPVLK
jgi:hypothetical protein